MNRKAFTLLELIIVLALLAILASAAVIRFTDIAKKAIDTQELATIASLRTAVLLFRAVNGYWPGEMGKDPAGDRRDLFSLLANPPPYFLGGIPPPDGKTWRITNGTGGYSGCPGSPQVFPIVCPHYVNGVTGKYFEYLREDIAGCKAGEIHLYLDYGH